MAPTTPSTYMHNEAEVDHSASSRNDVDPSVNVIRIADTDRRSISLSILYLNHFINNSCRRGYYANNTINIYVDIGCADTNR